MKIQVASDLHLEFKENRNWLRKNPLVPAANLLILAGDTVPYVYRHFADEFLDYFSREFKQVFTIFGNHEFYRAEINSAYPKFDELLRPNIRLMNNVSLDYEHFRFIFTTLWTDIPLYAREDIQAIMNDFRIIRKRSIFKELQPFQIEDMINYNMSSTQFLRDELEKAVNEKVIVVTHHVPLFEALPPSYLESSLKFAYANDLKSMIKRNPQIKVWINGHCHYPDKRYVGKTIILRNPMGYVFQEQQNRFKSDLIIDV